MNSKIVNLVDVGATGGINSRWRKFKKYLFPVLFDADPRAEFPDEGVEQLVINKALNSDSGEIKINLCKKPALSSLYNPNFIFLRLYTDPDRFSVVDRVFLEASTLDAQISAEGLKRVDFIKLDTQGSELDILVGSREALKNVIGVESEVEFSRMYENQPLFSDLDSYLRDNGFSLFDIRRKYWKLRDIKFNKLRNWSRDKGILVWGDALYFKLPDSIIDDGDPGKCFRSAICFMAYGYDDHANYLIEKSVEKGLMSDDNAKTLRDMVANNIYTSIRHIFKSFLILVFSRMRMRRITRRLRNMGKEKLGG